MQLLKSMTFLTAVAAVALLLAGCPNTAEVDDIESGSLPRTDTAPAGIDDTLNGGADATDAGDLETDNTASEPAPEPMESDDEGGPSLTATTPAEDDSDDAPAPEAPENEPTEPAPAEPQPAETETADAATAEKSNKVTLGDPSLTAGIPGEGTLTAEQVQAWLEDESNHEVLEVSLPLGLSLGENQIQGLDDNPLTRAKIELGRQLYFDPKLSSDFTVSCASCHDPSEAFTRHTQFGVGIEDQEGGRNSPVAYNRILSNEQFWDGRAESLEDQAKGPIANPIEMGNTHEGCAECLKGIEAYTLQFERIFEDGITIDNVAKAIASFERAIVTGPSPYDYYEQLRPYLENFEPEDLELLQEDDPEIFAEYEAAKKASDEHPMSESAIRGRDLYFSERINCAACHVGANLADEKYHNLGVGMDKEEPDLGRYEVTGEEADKGAFKTPTIRNVELSAPYMHDGSQKTLEEVVEWYNKGGHPNPHLDEKIKKLDLNDQEKADLVAFMKACTGSFPKIETGRFPEL